MTTATFPGARSARQPFDPPAEYTQWREQPGLHQAVWNGHTVWVVSRYEDIKAAMTDPRVSAQALALQSNGAHDGTNAPDIFPRMDDPEHARLRRMLTKDFTVKRVNAMRPGIQQMADDLIDAMIAGGQPANLVTDYALPLPSLVISLLLGVPYTDHDFFQTITATMMNINASRDEKATASRRFFGYMMELVARKEREPGDDLMSRLVHEHVLTGELRRETAAMNGVILLNAGHETTANMIALGTAALLENPAKAAVLRDTDDDAVVANAVEELLRYLTIVHSLVARVAHEDLEIGGQQVKAGEGLVMNLPAGNWDPAFAIDAGELDFDRAVRGHLAFGHGVHQCLGQVLARAELQIALPTLLRRLPGLRSTVPLEEIRFRNDMSIYGVHELPVAW
ncbi:cytochrome P450 [Actinoplanes derwentensis]|uniref:Cytochrome P450 n=1 Tax=Actinoplanes derwentensis TaxID=113562 RepID=A0A1H2B777_9ACTN|nr:cytochrome P450 [Actinoplanes derwentensis]GID86433.1 cytochrome P450 [Actinoplanes derwentensis]SDT54150.1 Cytochrome P450 [Actinoplanes derwentensis]